MHVPFHTKSLFICPRAYSLIQHVGLSTKKLQGMPKRKRKKILEFSNREFKITMFHMLKTLMEKVENMQEHIDNVSRETEILVKYQR